MYVPYLFNSTHGLLPHIWPHIIEPQLTLIQPHIISPAQRHLELQGTNKSNSHINITS